MNSREFKKILKPLIEQTVKEVLLQEGVLSTVISEVVKGVQPTLVESRAQNEAIERQKAAEQRMMLEEKKRKDIENRKKIINAAGFNNVDIFKGTEEIIPEGNQHGALSGMHPKDAGVDISAIQKLSNGKWRALAGEK